MHAEARTGKTLRWGRLALLFSALLMGAKIAAYAYTGSLAVLSDALESIVNVVTSSFALFAVWLSGHPRDSEHPYGHGKVEYLAELAEGVAIGTAGIAILVVTGARSSNGLDAVEGGWIGVGITAVIALATVFLGGLVRSAGKRLRSPSLAADGLHLQTDGITTVGTFLALAIVRATGWVWVDATVAVVLGLWLCWSAWRIMRSAAGGLMDEADPAELDRIAKAFAAVREPGWIAPHETKVHRLGGEVHVDMHMVFPRFWSLERAHDVATFLDRTLEDVYGSGADLALHMEACTPVSCSYCDYPDCPVRSAPQTETHEWTGDYIAAPFRHGNPDDPKHASHVVL